MVGPSGSGKGSVAKKLEERGFAKRIFSYTTLLSSGHRHIPEAEFDATDFIAKTVYAGVKYGLSTDDIEEHLSASQNVSILTDICGAVALKRRYPTLIIFCRRSREQMIEDILEKDKSNEEKKWRLLSMENELKNENLCDYVVRTENIDSAADEIMILFK